MEKHSNRNVAFIILIVFVAVLLGAILGVEFVAYKDFKIEQKQEVNINAQGKTDKINLNTATQKELETLGGIGQTKAKKIIEKRPYANVNELINIIGEKTFYNIKDEVEVK